MMSFGSWRHHWAWSAALLLLPQLLMAQAFNVGSISSSPVDETKKFLPLANYLGRQLRSDGIDRGKVVVAESIPAMASLLRAQQVDLYIDSLFPAYAVSRLSGSKLVLRRWKRGHSEYRSVIFARKDSGISRLGDLKGKVVAFEEPYSSSGYFFPKTAFLEKGMRLAAKRQGSEPVRPDEVGYIFSRGDTNTLFMVLNGAVAAGAIDGDKYFLLAKNLDNFKILHQTVSFPRQIVSHRADLPAKLAARVIEILLAMPRTEEGRQVLRAFESTSKFDEIPAQSIEFMEGLKKYVDAEFQLQK